MDAAQLRPLAVGEILDLAIKIYRERFTHLVKAVAVVVAPVSAIGALVQLSLPGGDATLATGTDELGRPVVEATELWTFVAGLFALGLISYVGSQLAAAASFKLVSGAYLDEEPDWRRSLAFAISKLGSLIWLTVVFAVLIFLALVAFVIPAFYFYVAWTVAVPVLLLEDLGGGKALKRSRALVRGRWWPTAGALLVAFILGGIVQGVLGGLLIAVTSAGGNDVVDAAAQAVGSTVSSVLTTPFTAAVIMVLYFDLRVRKEGFDLELLAQRVGVEPGPGAWTPPPPAGVGGGWQAPGAGPGGGWPPAPGAGPGGGWQAPDADPGSGPDAGPDDGGEPPHPPPSPGWRSGD